MCDGAVSEEVFPPKVAGRILFAVLLWKALAGDEQMDMGMGEEEVAETV